MLAAAVGVVGAVAQKVVIEAQTTVLTLVPYLDSLRWCVHRGGTRGHCCHDPRPAQRLAPGAAMIAALLNSEIAASPWMRSALRFGSVVCKNYLEIGDENWYD